MARTFASSIDRDAFIVESIEVAGKNGNEIGDEIGMGRGQVYNIYRRVTGRKMPVRTHVVERQKIKEIVESLYHRDETEEIRVSHLLLSIAFAWLDAEKLSQFTSYPLPAVELFLKRADEVGVISLSESWIRADWFDALMEPDNHGEGIFEVALMMDAMVVLGTAFREVGDEGILYSMTAIKPKAQPKERPKPQEPSRTSLDETIVMVRGMIERGEAIDPSDIAKRTGRSIGGAEMAIASAYSCR